MADERQSAGAAAYDAYLKSLFVINVDDPANVYPDVNTVWVAFEKKLGAAGSLVAYEPIFREFVQLGFQVRILYICCSDLGYLFYVLGVHFHFTLPLDILIKSVQYIKFKVRKKHHDCFCQSNK